jgi:dihydrofolate reductase
MRKLSVFIACSVDGYIADDNDSLDFLHPMHDDAEDYGYNAFYEGIDTVIIGRKTYDKVMSFEGPFPHEDKTCYVFSRKAHGNTPWAIFVRDNPIEFVQRIKAEKGKGIYCDGGGTLVSQLIAARLVDELILSVVPCTLGRGVRLFHENMGGYRKMQLLLSKSYPSGLVQLRYALNC